MCDYFIDSLLTRGETCPSEKEQANMLREDVAAREYRKLTLMLEQEQLEQAESSQGCNQPKTLAELGKQLVHYHRQLRQQVKLGRQVAGIEVQLGKLGVDRRALLGEIRSWVESMEEIVKYEIGGREGRVLEQMLIQKGRKHNLATVLTNFLKELKQAAVVHCLIDLLQPILRQHNLKMDQIYAFPALKNPTNSFLPCLQQLNCSKVHLQLTEIIQKLSKTFFQSPQKELSCLTLLEQTGRSIQLLAKVLRQIDSRRGSMMDFRIGLQLLTSQNSITESRIWSQQQQMDEFISKQALELAKEYGLTHQSGESYQEYFHKELASKYKAFIVGQLKLAQRIDYLKEKVDDESIKIEEDLRMLQQFEGKKERCQMEIFQNSDSMQMSRNERRQEDSSYLKESKEYIEYESESYEEAHSQQSKYVEQTKQDRESRQGKYISKRPSTTISINSSKHQTLNIFDDEVDEGPSPRFHPLRELPTPNPNSQQMTTKFTSLLHSIRPEKYIVQKILTIGRASHQPAHRPKDTEFEVRITKKYLILQPLTHHPLVVREKMEVNRIKSSNVTGDVVALNCGGCNLRLKFTGGSVGGFVKQLKAAMGQ